jgi:hypothetical protein
MERRESVMRAMELSEGEQELVTQMMNAHFRTSGQPYSYAPNLVAGMEAAFAVARAGVRAGVVRLMQAYAVEGGEPDRKEYPADTCEELIARLQDPQGRARVRVAALGPAPCGWVVKLDGRHIFGDMSTTREIAEVYAVALQVGLEASK